MRFWARSDQNIKAESVTKAELNRMIFSKLILCTLCWGVGKWMVMPGNPVDLCLFIQDRSGYERTIIYSMSLGGDTDTIATMAGAMAGAYYGVDSIPSYLREACEGVQDAFKFADQLYNLTVEAGAAN